MLVLGFGFDARDPLLLLDRFAVALVVLVGAPRPWFWLPWVSGEAAPSMINFTLDSITTRGCQMMSH